MLDELDNDNIPGIYDSLNTTQRDHDDALARYIITTALMKDQCVWVTDKRDCKGVLGRY